MTPLLHSLAAARVDPDFVEQSADITLAASVKISQEHSRV